jgi:methylglutaconyl-CoA hydratase
MPADPITQPVDIRFDDGERHAEVRILRPETGNTLDGGVIAALTDAFRRLGRHPTARTVILSSEGATFCAGIDLAWMRAGAEDDAEGNLRGAGRLGALFKAIHDCPIPTIALIQGDAVGAGLGMVAACDIAIAADTARFWTREVRTGILPALMSPYVIQAIGPRRAKFHFLTAQPFSAPCALEYGLLHDVCPAGDIRERAGLHARDILLGSPSSMAATKDLVAAVAERPIDDALVAETVSRIALFRASPMARTGIACAIDGVTPPWVRLEGGS